MVKYRFSRTCGVLFGIGLIIGVIDGIYYWNKVGSIYHDIIHIAWLLWALIFILCLILLIVKNNIIKKVKNEPITT